MQAERKQKHHKHILLREVTEVSNDQVNDEELKLRSPGSATCYICNLRQDTFHTPSVPYIVQKESYFINAK